MPSMKSLFDRRTAVLAGLALSACRLDMHDAPRFDSMEPSELFADGTSARTPVEGTIARGKLRDGNPGFFTGMDADGAWLTELPPEVELNAGLLERGKERYDIFCSPCHGYTGAGNGMIVQRGFQPPPTFHNTRNREEGLGRIAFIIGNGYGAMYSYAHAVKPKDRWAIAAYVRTLQLAAHAPLAAASGDDLSRLEEQP